MNYNNEYSKFKRKLEWKGNIIFSKQKLFYIGVIGKELYLYNFLFIQDRAKNGSKVSFETQMLIFLT